MKRETQLDLIDRINVHRAVGRGTDAADSSMRVPTSNYTDTERFEHELRLLTSAPTLVGLSGMLPGPNTFAVVDLAGRSVVLTRDGDGALHGLLNVCSHRGAEVAEGCGSAARLSCPYHGWTYYLDGSSAARRRGEFFDDTEAVGMTPVPVAEDNGMIWVAADANAVIGDSPLQGAEDELQPFDLGSYRLFGTRSFSRRLNWKLAVDTFAEAHHVGVLHSETLDPMIYSDFALFDAFGSHGRMISPRRSIDILDETERGDWDLLPHATILWYFQPNTVFIHQQDHVQVYRANPGPTPDECELVVSVYVPPDSERSDRHWQRNFDLLIDVTDTEDFSTMVGAQRGFYSGAHETVLFGRNEPALQHFHQSLDGLLNQV